MNSLNSAVAFEVRIVECENRLDAIDMHCSNQARVVNLDARDVMRHQQLAPFFVNRESIRKQPEFFLEKNGAAVRLVRRETVAIAVNRTRTGVPKLCNILGGLAKNAVAPKNRVRG